MPSPIYPQNVGSAIVVTAANAIANNAYANTADRMRIQRISYLALLVDFKLTSVTFATAPVGGSLQLFAVDRDFAGNVGPTPVSTLNPRLVGTFTPSPAASNASTGWIMAINNVSCVQDADYYVYNNGTAYSLNSGWILTAQCWTPGS